MKAVIYAVLLCVLMSLPAMGACTHAPSEAAARHEIFRLLRERRNAFYRGDVDKFQEFEADDFTRISQDGQFVTKQEQVAYVRTRNDAPKTIEGPANYADQHLKLNIFCTIAVLTGVLTETGPSDAGVQVQRSRFTEVWIFRHGHWLTLHNHYTTIAP